jgi:Cu/Ag efflux protein CusF
MGSGSATGSSMGMESSKNELTGTVQKFDRETKELTLANSDKKLKVSESTTVMKDGQAGTLSDIKEGEQVRASFSGSGDTLQVSQIEVMTAGTTGTGTSGMGTGSTGTTTPPSDTGTGSTGTTTTPPSDTGTGTTTTPPSDTGTTKTPDSGSSGATPPPSKGY